MSQAEIIEVLEKAIVPLASIEISNKLKDNPKKIMKELRSLLKYKEVNFIEIDRVEAMKRFNCKRRMRLWIINGDY